MYKEKRVAAIIAAAGKGQRMGSSTPKQFLRIGNKTVLEKTTEAFENNASVDDIYIIAPSGYTNELRDFFAHSGEYSKIRSVTEGGVTRQKSIFYGIEEIKNQTTDKFAPDNVIALIHDAARPFLTQSLINEIIEATYEKGAAVPAVPVKDTIKTADNNIIRNTPDRSKLYCAQTPQGFLLEILTDAYKKAEKDGFPGTDDASLVERSGYEVFIVEGEEKNIKITTPSDVPDLGKYDGERVGIGFDVHAFASGRALILGGIEIPHEKGLSGHSDADVLTHAFMDAILGALNLGDIGTNFPDNDMTYKDISSIILLRNVVELAAGNGYILGNADLIIIAEEPKMKDHIPAMQSRLSEAAGVGPDRISIKATTTEGLGFTGRGEGIGAQAIVRMVKSS